MLPGCVFAHRLSQIWKDFFFLKTIRTTRTMFFMLTISLELSISMNCPYCSYCFLNQKKSVIICSICVRLCCQAGFLPPLPGLGWVGGSPAQGFRYRSTPAYELIAPNGAPCLAAGVSHRIHRTHRKKIKRSV